jgi:hypothetical protein
MEDRRIPGAAIAIVGPGEANPWGLADAIASVVLPEFALQVVDLPLDEERLADYTGHWRFGYGDARFFARDGHLWIDDRGGTGEMLFQGDETFSFEGDNERLQFTRDESGAVVGARWFSDTDVDDPGVRVPSGNDD